MTASRPDGGCWPPHPGPAARTEQARNQILSCSCYGGSQATSKSRRRSGLLTVSSAPLTVTGIEVHDHRLGGTSSCGSHYFLQWRSGNLRNHAGISVSGRVAVQGLMRYTRTSAAWSPVMRDWPYAMPWERELSPLARGLHLRQGQGHRRRRIIPARAGFTRPRRPGPVRGPDHPRACGVYDMPPRPPEGSPWIIPARAGFTPRWTRRPRRPVGSSPRVRGLHGRHQPQDAQRRIIPACAGFTWRRSTSRRWRRDHPRMRGVYLEDVVYGPVGLGSSPHARGLP